MASSQLSWRHGLLALAVVAVWGSNFAVIRVGLQHLPPLLFAALRFTFAFVPGAFFIRRPAVAWRNLSTYGMLVGAGQFGILYIAMNGQISPGLASLVIQMQVFFTIGLSMAFTRERVKAFQWAALALGASGIVVIALHVDAATTVLGLVLTLIAAVSWGCANTVSRAAGKVDMLAYVVWASLFSAVPLYVLSLIFEGWPAMVHGVVAADWATWVTVLWQSYGNVLFGFGAWAWLLARYPAATVSPMALLVPIFGMGASAWFLGEPLPPWKLFAAALVMSGLAVGILWPQAMRRFTPAPSSN